MVDSVKNIAVDLAIVLNAAVTNSCSCADGKASRESGHQTACWVHTNWPLLRRVQKHIEWLQK